MNNALSTGGGTPPQPTGETPALQRITEASIKVGAERVRILQAARPLLRGGKTLAEAAASVGTNAVKLCRLQKQFGHLQDHELTVENLASDFANCGRSSAWEFLAEQGTVRQKLQQLYLLTLGSSSDYMAKDRRTGSAALTLERFADDALCPPSLARALRAGSQPKPLLKVIREITAEIEAKQRGPKHSQLAGQLTQRRELIEVLNDGSEVPIQLGDWWVFDDMSTNSPFWFAGPSNNTLVGRQGLYGYDLRRRWLGVELVGTSRDSYTAAIILRFLRRLMQAFGKPRRGVVFERSVWQARSIAGFRVTASGQVYEEEIERAAMSQEDQAMIQQGLRALGIEVVYTYTPRGKEIEGAFNYLQRVFPTFAPEAVNIGRHRGEFEHGAKQLRRAHANSFHPEDLGFIHIDAHGDISEKAMVWINRRQSWKEEAAGETTEQYPQLAPLSQRDLAVFLPRKHELEIRSGKVSPEIDGEPFDFCAPEMFARLGAKYRVYVKFDPSEPTLGAAIYNRESSSANFAGYQEGEFICFAEYLPTIARFGYRYEVEGKAVEMAKRFNGYVRTAFRAVGMPKHRASTARDGRGNVIETSGGRAAEQALQVDGREVARQAKTVRVDSTEELLKRATEPQKDEVWD